MTSKVFIYNSRKKRIITPEQRVWHKGNPMKYAVASALAAFLGFYAVGASAAPTCVERLIAQGQPTSYNQPDMVVHLDGQDIKVGKGEGPSSVCARADALNSTAAAQNAKNQITTLTTRATTAEANATKYKEQLDALDDNPFVAHWGKMLAITYGSSMIAVACVAIAISRLFRKR
jgi:hypothetical protein